MEKRKNFYSSEMDYNRMNEVLEYVISNLTLPEVLKMVREISYDMICYYSEDSKGIVYNGEYNRHQIEQASRLQRLLSASCDLFCQSIIGHREFDDGYLAKWIDGEYLQNRVRELEEKLNYENN